MDTAKVYLQRNRKSMKYLYFAYFKQKYGPGSTVNEDLLYFTFFDQFSLFSKLFAVSILLY